MTEFSFPNHYPPNCPPKPHQGLKGEYYRLVKNGDILDETHFKSYYETNRMPKLEATKACSRRGVSVFKAQNETIILSKQFPRIGKYIAHLNLNGGHGVVCYENYHPFKTHFNWWVPTGVNACDYCLKSEGPIS